MSCTSNLIEFLEYTTAQIDEGTPVDIVYYDFSKAFDKVSIPKLMVKLKSYGIGGKILIWIENWLKGRMQRTIIDGVASPWVEVLSGVPQGSVLGPLLFIIFIDDIDDYATSIDKIGKFADDTKTANKATTPNDCQNLQTCIDRMYEWSSKWSMIFNVQKCKVLHVGHNNRRHSYTMNNQNLQVCDLEKDIGVTINRNLKPNDHCARVTGTALGIFYQLIRSFHYRDKKVFRNLFTTYVRPHLEFASPAWAPWQCKDIEKIENVQRKFVRNVNGLKNKTYEGKLHELGLLTLKDRRVYLDLVEVYKIINGLTRMDRNALFVLTGDAERRHTRNTECPLNIVLKRSNLEIRRNFFSTRAAIEWNSLPVDIKMCTRLSMFKTNLKSHLMTNYLEHEA